MEQVAVRSLTNQLAEDLAWLEEHARSQTPARRQAAELHYAAALLRNVVAPISKGMVRSRCMSRLSAGQERARAPSPTCCAARFWPSRTRRQASLRHPVALRPHERRHRVAGRAWVFSGRAHVSANPSRPALTRTSTRCVRVSQGGGEFGVLDNFSSGDCPDMTTWQATGYRAALARSGCPRRRLVYVASDERYNDAVPDRVPSAPVAFGQDGRSSADEDARDRRAGVRRPLSACPCSI